MRRLHKINNQRFSIRLCTIAGGLGITRVGTLYNFLRDCKPSTTLAYHGVRVRGHKLCKEVEEYLGAEAE